MHSVERGQLSRCFVVKLLVGTPNLEVGRKFSTLFRPSAAGAVDCFNKIRLLILRLCQYSRIGYCAGLEIRK